MEVENHDGQISFDSIPCASTTALLVNIDTFTSNVSSSSMSMQMPDATARGLDEILKFNTRRNKRWSMRRQNNILKRSWVLTSRHHLTDR